MLAGCSEPARISQPLSFEQKVARMQACNRLLREANGYRAMRAPGNGGVIAERWIELSRGDQDELIDLTACLRTRGDTGEIKIEIFDQGRVLRTRRVANDRDFAAMLDE